jgi:hypothetical protein
MMDMILTASRAARKARAPPPRSLWWPSEIEAVK